MSKIQLSDHFNYGKLIKYTLPSVIMVVVTSIYGVVDGFFVSNFVGKTAFTAVNFIMPFLIILGTFGFMFGTGGSAIVAITLGEGNGKTANRRFSLFVYSAAACGIVFALFGIIFIRPIAALLGAEGKMLDECVEYGRIILLALPWYILQYEFQCVFPVAEKPKLGLYVTIAAGVTNIILDALFVAAFSWGIQGAALATGLSQTVGGLVPIIYFARPNKSLLRLGKTKFDGRALLRVCINGSSEFMSTVSMSVVSMLYNAQLLRYIGEDGVAAYGMLMYVGMIFLAIFMGYSIGAAPIVGFHFGAANYDELKNLLKKSITLITASAVLMFLSAKLTASPLSRIFVGYDEDLLKLTLKAFNIFSYSFLLSGFSMFASSFFTALNNGIVSAVISFLRTFVFQVAAVIVFPLICGADGIWFSTVAAEALAVIIAAVFIVGNKKKYHY